MADMLMTAGTTGEGLGLGAGLSVSGGAGSKQLDAAAAAADYIGVSLTTVAGESILAGDVVGAFKYGIRKGYGIQTGSVEIDSIGVTLNGLTICALSATLFVKLYIKNADTKLYAQAFKVDANAWTITEGAEVTVANYVVSTTCMKIRRINDTTFVASWIQNSDTHAYCIGGSVDSTPTITLDAGGQVEWHNAVTASGVGYTGYDFRLVDTNKIMWAFRDGGDSSYGHCVIGTLVGTVVTVATANEAKFSGTSAADDICIAVYSATRGEIFYEVAAGLQSIMYKISTTTPSFGTAYAPASGTVEGTAAEGFGLYRSVLAAGMGTSWLNLGGSYGYSNELTYGYVYWSVAALNIQAVFLNLLSPLMGIVTYADVTSGSINAYLFKMSAAGHDPSAQGPTVIHAVSGRGAFAVDISTDKKILAVLFQDAGDSTHGHILLYDVGVPIGIAQAADNGGGSLDICIWGMSDIHSGLTPNAMYYMNTDGSLSTTPNSFPVGMAYSATQILVEKSPCVLV